MGSVSLLLDLEILYLSVDILIRVIDVISRGPGRDWQREIRPLVPQLLYVRRILMEVPVLIGNYPRFGREGEGGGSDGGSGGSSGGDGGGGGVGRRGGGGDGGGAGDASAHWRCGTFV